MCPKNTCWKVLEKVGPKWCAGAGARSSQTFPLEPLSPNEPIHDLSGTFGRTAAPERFPLAPPPELIGSPDWQSQTGRVWVG